VDSVSRYKTRALLRSSHSISVVAYCISPSLSILLKLLWSKFGPNFDSFDTSSVVVATSSGVGLEVCCFFLFFFLGRLDFQHADLCEDFDGQDHHA
jgi:hypothetical protein